MAKRPFIKLTDRQPPVSSDEKRFWLELYIPERVQGHGEWEKRSAVVMGLHLGGGQFRLQGDPNVTAERIGSWRRLAGITQPVTSAKPTFASYGIAGG